MNAPDLDLGDNITAVFTSHGTHERAGLVEWHPCDGGTCRNPETGAPGRCGGSILFDLPGIRDTFPGRDLWTVESLDPLTLSPSVACACRGCRHHGFIRDGRWHPA